MTDRTAFKDPNNIEPYFVVWCDKSGLNDGSSSDRGELQGAFISTAAWTFADTTTTGRLAEHGTGHNQNAVTINGVAYAANTVATIWLSAGVDGVDYDILCRITTTDGRTLDKTITVPVRTL